MLATVLIAVVAFIHLYILVLEMFLWDTRTGHKAFNLSPEFARETRVLAANQGLYNGFLAAGLLWSLWLGEEGVHVAIFFLACVLIAGRFCMFRLYLRLPPCLRCLSEATRWSTVRRPIYLWLHPERFRQL